MMGPRVHYDIEGKPYLICYDGNTHWLSLIEHMLFKIGLLNLKRLDKKHNGDPCKG